MVLALWSAAELPRHGPRRWRHFTKWANRGSLGGLMFWCRGSSESRQSMEQNGQADPRIDPAESRVRDPAPSQSSTAPQALRKRAEWKRVDDSGPSTRHPLASGKSGPIRAAPVDRGHPLKIESFRRKEWRHRPDSNRGMRDLQSLALPTWRRCRNGDRASSASFWRRQGDFGTAFGRRGTTSPRDRRRSTRRSWRRL